MLDDDRPCRDNVRVTLFGCVCKCGNECEWVSVQEEMRDNWNGFLSPFFPAYLGNYIFASIFFLHVTNQSHIESIEATRRLKRTRCNGTHSTNIIIIAKKKEIERE